MSSPEPRSKPSLADLYPALTAEERAEAEDALTRYVELALRIFERERLRRSDNGSEL